MKLVVVAARRLKIFLISWNGWSERGRGRDGQPGAAVVRAADPAHPFNLLPRLTRIRRCVPAKLKDLLRVPPLLNVLHTRPSLMCVFPTIHAVRRNYISHES